MLSQWLQPANSIDALHMTYRAALLNCPAEPHKVKRVRPIFAIPVRFWLVTAPSPPYSLAIYSSKAAMQ